MKRTWWYWVSAWLCLPGVVSSAASDAPTPPQFSHARGFYDEPFELTLSCETADATIRYTTDGSAPTAATGRVYDGVLTIDATTCVRAAAFVPGSAPSSVQTHTYIFLNQVVVQSNDPPGASENWSDYEMDPRIVDDPVYGPQMRAALESLPTMSVVMDTNDLFGSEGIYEHFGASGPEWERPASVELIYPDGTEGFQVDCGIEIYGGVGRYSKKKSLQLSFERDYGPTKLRYPLFGPDAADEFDQIILRAGFNDASVWGGARAQYIRDEYVRRLQLALGRPASHGIFVHLYLNGFYWGLYNPCERPQASFAATYFGGDKDDWDALNSGRPTGDSSTDNWDAMLDLVWQDVRTNAAYQRLQGNDPNGTPNPAYTDYLDVDNYIDFLIANFFAGNEDWPEHNWYVAMNRADPSGWKTFTWDAECSAGLTTDATFDQTTSDQGICEPYGRLRENAEFCMAFADRVQKAFFEEGPLGIDPADEDEKRSVTLYAELADAVELAILGESARWGDIVSVIPFTPVRWQAERDRVLETYLPERAAIVLSQFIDAGLYPVVEAPAFDVDGISRHDGHVAPGTLLTMSAADGTIYYTTDGTDPRLPIPVSGNGEPVTLVSEGASKRVLVPGAAADIGQGNAWTLDGFDDSSWLTGQGGVGFETGPGSYDHYFQIDVSDAMFSRNASCFARIPFVVEDPSATNLTLRVRYDDGFVAYLNGSEIARRNATAMPTWNSAASNANPDGAAVFFETIDVSEHANLLVPGDNILAVHAMNRSASDPDFLFSAELLAEYAEIGAISPNAMVFSDTIPLTQSVHVKARTLAKDWSALSEATFGVGPVAENLRISEMMYHPIDIGRPDDAEAEYIELTNIGSEAINLNLVRFTDGVDFAFGNVDLAPGEYVVVVRDVAAFEARYGTNVTVAGEYTGKLDNAGERIELQDAAGQVIHEFVFDDGWYDLTDGLGYSLTVVDPALADASAYGNAATWRRSADADGSPGRAETGEN